MKKGRFSVDEIDYIEKNATTRTATEIAKHLNRDPASVKKFCKEKLRVGLSKQDEAAFTLEDRPYWKELKQQFSEDELELMKWHWSRIVLQFKDDVIHTEEFQILDLIKLDILSNRCLKHNQDMIETINQVDAMLEYENSKSEENRDNDAIFNLRREKISLQQAQETSTKEYRELQVKKNGMLKEMRATREQRVRRLEESTQSLTGWVVFLMNNPEKTKEYGLQMRKMQLAMEKEQERLGEWHTYSDGTVDQPFLNSNTVK